MTLSSDAGRLSDEERFDWLRLFRSENVGPKSFQGLLSKFGRARTAIEALPDVARRAGSDRAIKIASIAEIEAEFALARKLGIEFVALGEPAYPPMLAHIDSRPPIIAVLGRFEALQQPMIAIVGSRNASAAGLAFTDRLGRALGEAGYVVVSGLARGIDHRAHIATLSTGTIGVLAGGHARPYPNEAAALMPRISEHGAVVSEMPLEWEPRGRDFPRRNRIVSGLSLGVVVVEATRSSGSLITARLAAEQNREVFAVPGSPLDPRAEGTIELLRSGAGLCAHARDILDVIEPLRQREGGAHFSEGATEQDRFMTDDRLTQSIPGELNFAHAAAAEYQEIMGLLGPSPIAIDDLIRSVELAPGLVRSLLLDLQLAGKIDFESGDRIVRITH